VAGGQDDDGGGGHGTDSMGSTLRPARALGSGVIGEHGTLWMSRKGFEPSLPNLRFRPGYELVFAHAALLEART
jgi:hypothetical protein